MVGDTPRQLRTRAEASKDTSSEDTKSRVATKANRVPARGSVKPSVLLVDDRCRSPLLDPKPAPEARQRRRV